MKKVPPIRLLGSNWSNTIYFFSWMNSMSESLGLGSTTNKQCVLGFDSKMNRKKTCCLKRIYTFFVSLFVHCHLFAIHSSCIQFIIHEKCGHSIVNGFMFKKLNRIYQLISTGNQAQFHSNRAGLNIFTYETIDLWVLAFFMHNKLPTAAVHSYGKKWHAFCLLRWYL